MANAVNSSQIEVKKNFVISDDSDDDIPLALKLKNPLKHSTNTKQPINYSTDLSSSHSINKCQIISDDDLPLSLHMSTANKRTADAFDDDDDDDVPLIQKITKIKKPANSATSHPAKKDAAKKQRPSLNIVTIADTQEASSSDSKDSKKSRKKSKSSQLNNQVNSGEDGTDNDGEHRWWEDQSFLEDGTIKWNTLEHSGVLFPPEYIPHGIPLVYDGQDIVLPSEAEEVAGFYAQLIETEHAQNQIFVNNFWSDFRHLLCTKFPTLAAKIVKFESCDFSKIQFYYNQLKEEKKTLTKDQKEKIKSDKQKQEDKFMFCMLDGRKEKVGNFRVEPPGLFRGRGKHPKAGKLKTRVVPEQITINIGKGAVIPEPPAGHSWGKVIHNNEVAWLACWVENINNSYKYVLFAANSSLKGQSDFKKFEKARELKNHIDRIRKTIQSGLVDENQLTRQRTTALWLIDVLALRAGNEKGDDEADTVGCCSLRKEHITLEEPNFVIFDFLGKDSIRYYNRVAVDKKIFKNLKLFMKGKQPSDPLFDRLTPPSLNNFLDTLMPGLTAKVFRTFNASFTFQRLLGKTPDNLETVHEKMLYYNRSNREVAILCNHQRAVPKTHHTSISKLKEKIDLAKLQRVRIKKCIQKAFLPKDSKEHQLEIEEESDFDDDKIAEMEEVEKRLDAEKAEKLSQKKSLHSDTATLQTSSNPADDEPISQSSQSHQKNSHSYDTLSVEKLEKALQRFNTKISVLKTQLIDRDENKTTALGTSKINYLDPRISAAWCKKHSVPIEKIFSKTLRDKFRWAIAVDANWVF